MTLMKGPQLLDELTRLRADVARMPSAMLEAILARLPDDMGAMVENIILECQAHERDLKAQIALVEQEIRAYVLATGASLQGQTLQAVIVAPRVTWDTKQMGVYATLHPEVLAYRRVGEPSVTIRSIHPAAARER